MDTLLEKAKKYGRNKRSRPISDQDVELALAWLKNEINTAQATRAYDSNSEKSTAFLYRIAKSLQKAYQDGRIKIVI